MRRAQTKIKVPEVVTDPAESAKAAGLRYVSDARPGIRGKRSGRGSGISIRGHADTRSGTLKRIRSLVIPPAWTDVWICPSANGHLQATGRDARGRKQSRYHPRWRAMRDETKYERMMLFGDGAAGDPRRVEEDLGLPGLPREKVWRRLCGCWRRH